MVFDVEGNLSELIDKEYFNALKKLLERNREPEKDEGENVVYVGELTYCTKRLPASLKPSMLLGIERDKGVKAILQTNEDVGIHNNILEAYKRGDRLTLAKLGEKLRERQGTRDMVFVAPERDLRMFEREIKERGRKIKIVGSPDFFVLTLKPLKFREYEIPSLSLIPIEKKTGKKDAQKYRVALEQGMIYAWLMNAPAFIVQSDWARYVNGDTYVVSNDLYIFVPYFDEKIRKSFEERLKRRARIIFDMKTSGKITWFSECNAIPLAALGIYAIKTSVGKRKSEDEIMMTFVNIGARIAREDGLEWKVGLEHLIKEVKSTKRDVNGELRNIITRIVNALSEIRNETIVPWEEIRKVLDRTLDCLYRKGWDVSSYLREAARSDDATKKLIEDLMRKDGRIEIYEFGASPLSGREGKISRDAERCIEEALWSDQLLD